MRKFYLTNVLMSAFAMVASGYFSYAQCPAGYSSAKLNWDNLDYLSQNGNYAGFVTNSMMQTQAFTFGVNRLTINIPSTITTNGETTNHTGETGSYGSGADVEYNGNGTITISFDTAVFNLQFSLYDIDTSQSVTVTAEDGSAVPVALNVNLSTLAGTVLTVNSTGVPVANASANLTNAAITSTDGTLNIAIAGNSPALGKGVKKVTITLGGLAGDFWLSDLSACASGSFPLKYYAAQKPWTNQPSYYLVTPDNNSVYLMNPLTGQAQWLFSEPGSPWVNSMGYDHVNKILYYVMDHSSPVSTNRSLKKYDFNTETISTVVSDITTLGIPLYDIVVESGGAAFYNGSLFIGIEGTNTGKNSARESIIWRIDFDASQNPVQAAQVFAQPTDNGKGTLMHDWGDFTIKDGVLYDFNTGNSGSTSQFVHLDMQSGNTVIFNTNGNPAPIQVGQTWDGTLYWTGGQGSEGGKIAKYNEDGTIGTKITATVTACSPAWVGRAGDASDPFRPKSDFGDAPASYDAASDNKATHEYDCNLRLGNTYDREWDKTASGNATADGADEDGISTITILTRGTVNYVQSIKVFNNTGSSATLAGWLDYNGNGVFDAGEGRTLSISSKSTIQTVNLSWLNINVALNAGTNTFLRIRVTSATNNMTTNNATGWFANGEVEDYVVPVDYVLPVRMLSFTASADGDHAVVLNWITGKEQNFQGFDIERSSDGTNWTRIGNVEGRNSIQEMNSYRFTDQDPLHGKSYYRLKMIYVEQNTEYSEIRPVVLRSDNWVRISPNPVHDQAMLQYSLDKPENVTLQVTNAAGSKMMNKNLPSVQGRNQVNISDWGKLAPGIYVVQLLTTSEVLTTRMVVE